MASAYFTLLAGLALLLILSFSSLKWFILPSAIRGVKSSSSRRRKLMLQSFKQTIAKPVVVGFFHPYCNAGGGGERVLWAAIRSTHAHFPQTFCVVYTGDQDVSKASIVERAKNAFGITLDATRLDIVHLSKRSLVSPETWPRFTLIGQSLGSLPLAYEAISKIRPDVFIDTMGYAFTYPLVHYLLGVPIATYTHYPTISSDMLARVDGTHALKLFYWRLFARLYAQVGSFADIVMANSTWTSAHLKELWRCQESLSIVYPPCDTSALALAPIDKPRKHDIVCVAQFRREKNHPLLLKAFAELRNKGLPSVEKARLIFIGTVRNDTDRAWIEDLRSQAQSLNIESQVDFRQDVPWPEVIETLNEASIGCNAMWNEHFGIGVVEYMAAGLICVVHDSGGPKLDIVRPVEGELTGFHATDSEAFAQCFARVVEMSEEDKQGMRRRAQNSAGRFSEEVFDEAWRRQMTSLLRLERQRKLA